MMHEMCDKEREYFSNCIDGHYYKPTKLNDFTQHTNTHSTNFKQKVRDAVRERDRELKRKKRSV